MAQFITISKVEFPNLSLAPLLKMTISSTSCVNPAYVVAKFNLLR